jgi:hypothetical protein
MQEDTGWERCSCILPRTLVTGERSGWLSNNLRRRCVSGVWQYRRPTENEIEDDLSRDTW